MKNLIQFTEPLNGWCPVQAEGLTECGLPWYFKARSKLYFVVGKTPDTHPLDNPLWSDHTEERDPRDMTKEYPAYLSKDEHLQFIANSLIKFASVKNTLT